MIFNKKKLKCNFLSMIQLFVSDLRFRPLAIEIYFSSNFLHRKHFMEKWEDQLIVKVYDDPPPTFILCPKLLMKPNRTLKKTIFGKHGNMYYFGSKKWIYIYYFLIVIFAILVWNIGYISVIYTIKWTIVTYYFCEYAWHEGCACPDPSLVHRAKVY